MSYFRQHDACYVNVCSNSHVARVSLAFLVGNLAVELGVLVDLPAADNRSAEERPRSAAGEHTADLLHRLSSALQLTRELHLERPPRTHTAHLPATNRHIKSE